MRTRFDFVHEDNRREARPLVLTYTDAASLCEAMRRSALGRFKQIRKAANARFYIEGALVQDWDGATPFPDGTLVVITDKPGPPVAGPPSSKSGPSAPVDFLHLATPVEEEAVRQVHRAAALDGMKRVVGMPDLHPGNSFPIGAAFVASRILPELVGTDIGCGMSLFPLEGVRADLSERRLLALAKRLGSDGFPPGCATPTAASQHSLATAHTAAFGTIGSGNHFAELQVVVEVMEPGALDASHAYLLVHSGSRTFGEAVAQRYKADGDLAAYRAAHDVAVAWAADNRRAIGLRFVDLCAGTLSSAPPLTAALLDITHNSVVATPGAAGEELFLHRKGAAPMDAGLVAIPGSRGTHTYLVRPTADAAVRDRCACSVAHGAGRALSRGKVTTLLTKRYQRRSDAVEALTRTPFNGHVVYDGRIEVLYEEAPEAYKNIEMVVQDLVAAGAVTVVAIMKPLITCKL